ncbi:hypothetical protein C8J57DRAFT_1514930 [Mycena rebaudengoi]|nr:hypothetical protein C8J57DRAFT_1514930 [Mycena rebaudengoi]
MYIRSHLPPPLPSSAPILCSALSHSLIILSLCILPSLSVHPVPTSSRSTLPRLLDLTLHSLVRPLPFSEKVSAPHPLTCASILTGSADTDLTNLARVPFGTPQRRLCAYREARVPVRAPGSGSFNKEPARTEAEVRAARVGAWALEAGCVLALGERGGRSPAFSRWTCMQS